MSKKGREAVVSRRGRGRGGRETVKRGEGRKIEIAEENVGAWEAVEGWSEGGVEKGMAILEPSTRPIGVDKSEGVASPSDNKTLEAARGGEDGVGRKGQGRGRACQYGDTVVACAREGIVGPEHVVRGNMKGNTSLGKPKFNLCLGACRVTRTGTAHPGFLEANDVEASSMPSQDEAGHNGGGRQPRGVVGCKTEGRRGWARWRRAAQRLVEVSERGGK